MYKICKTERSARRQKEFQKALFSLLRNQDYSTITVTALCREANIPRNAFYRYFDTIEDVLDGEMDELIRESSLLLYQYPNIQPFFCFWLENRGFLDVLHKNEISSLFTVRAQVVGAKDISGEPMSVALLRNVFHFSGLMSILVLWHRTGMQQTPAEMEEIVKQIFQKD